MAYDVVIKGGTLVDGTGAAARRADVGIEGDRIAAIGPLDSSGAELVIDADGRIVTPGFVDLHSHLDAQIGWDPVMSSSCYHGVTSVVMGNCGMTFAPVRSGQADFLAEAMEMVEDIPASCILSGLPWNWEGYDGYLDTVEGLPLGINAGGYVGDVAVRLYVAGDAACDPEFRASAAQLAEMARLVESAVEAGALGYSISRSLFHRVPDGRNVPGTWSPPEEFFAITEPLGRLGRGVLESAPRYNDLDSGESRVESEVSWMAELSRRTGRPFSFNLHQNRSLGDHYREVMRMAADANATGAQLRPQITPRSVGVLFSLAANTIIDHLPSFQQLRDLDLDGRLQALRDPAVREQLVAEGAGEAPESYEEMYLMRAGQPAVYDYAPEDSLGALARAAGCSPVEFYLDAMVESGGESLVNWPAMNEDEAAVEEMITSPVTVMGLADAGAHATQIMDASQPTYFLARWVRDKQVLTIEEGVRALTSDTAGFIGFTDRGVIAEGAFADINVIDLEALALPLPEIVFDFPGDSPRFVQRAHGVDHTFVNGRHFMDRGEPTGTLAGRLLRS